ncbi:MAG TPA: extracellular solute-binding protein [Stellaceae bacterium]|nr:extracellular solute-binding protein [Stellaceae bacterium]
MLKTTIARGLALSALLGLTTGAAHAEAPPLPTSPVTLNIIDVAGTLALTQKAIEKYRDEHPKLVSKITFTKAPGPELAGKIKAQQNANRLDIDLVLSGTDGIAAGLGQDEWIKLLPEYAAKFPNLEANYLPAALKMQQLVDGYAVAVVYYPSGPLIEYAPERVKDIPKSTDELLAWCKAHPNRLMYARPANSGPGRTWLQALPYLLGDSDPKDPIKGWDKTWAYLKDLNSCIEYYPSGTGATMKEFGEGSRDIIITTTGWDINPRVLGTVPKSAEVGTLKGFHWVSDAQYMVVPKGISPDHLAVVLDLMAYMLKPEAQAYAYDDGYFYPGPAIKDVPLSMAPKSSQDAIKEFGRPEYDKLIAENPIEIPLADARLVAAFRKWDEDVGGAKLK